MNAVEKSSETSQKHEITHRIARRDDAKKQTETFGILDMVQWCRTTGVCCTVLLVIARIYASL